MEADNKNRAKPAPPIVTQKQVRLPMPVGGLNFSASTLDIPVTDAYVLDNMVVKAQGLEIRKGWREWLTAGYEFGAAVRSLMVYNAVTGVADSKLFACIQDEIGVEDVFDITTPDAAPSVAFTPSTAATRAGEWYSVNFRTSAGTFLIAVAEGAGVYVYSTSGGWVEVTTGGGAGQISFTDGSTTKDFCYIFIWKNRVWFLKKDSTSAYYLPVSSIAGAATAFDFGPLMLRGGYLEWGANWTYDAGSGLDDFFVLATNMGEVIVYQGTDPSSISSFAIKGVWYAGRIPGGRRGVTSHGGDLIFITEYGVVSLTDFVSGRITAPIMQSSVAIKINPTIASIVSTTMAEDTPSQYWGLIPYPSESILVLINPYASLVTGYYTHYLMNSLTNAWSTASNLDINCWAIFDGKFIFGTRARTVNQLFYGYRDGDSYDGTTEGDDVTGRINCAFVDCGSPTSNKLVSRARIAGRSDGIFSFRAWVKSEYQINELLSAPTPNVNVGSYWDVGLWNVAYWSETSASYTKWFGVAGFGKKVSLQMACRGTANTLLTDYELTFKEGLNL